MSADRFPVGAKALGVLKHQKKQICMLSVLWSDQNNVLIYREFEEFKKLHKRLKRKFPIESGVLKKSDRTIPTFREVNAILRKNHKLSRCVEALKSLEIYCQDLLKTQPNISRGEDVVCFFEAQNQDLDPSFPENSIIILPSKMEDSRTGEPAGCSRPVITQPVVAPLYRCLKAFDTDDVKENPFSASRAETLEVLMKDRTGWWLVENQRKQLAWFPASYLETTEEDPIVREPNEEEMLYYLTQPYEAKRSDELSVTCGVVVEVLEKVDTGWWLIWYNGRGGYVPSAFLQPYRNPHSKFLALAANCFSISTPNLSRIPGLSGKASPIQLRGCLDQAVRAHPSNRRRGEDLMSWSRARASIPSGCGWTTEMEGLAHSLGNRSRQESPWALISEGRRAKGSLYPETPQDPFGSRGHLCKQPSSASVASQGSCSDRSPCTRPSPACGSPPVPSRPTPCKILQKCSTVTKKAMRRALPQASPGPCGCHSAAL
uniref:NADPH oxidase organizer 1 isoform X1 n=1 Tax=Pogona vitticeps TaxID=103695 RepID=A0ABM5F135_9SAUR